MNRLMIKIKFSFVLLLSILLQTSMLRADDIAIFEAEKPPVPPNILFVMDVSGSMNWDAGDLKQKRIDVLRDALTGLLTEVTDVNVGLMSFSDKNAESGWIVHGPSYPVAGIDEDAQTALNANPLFNHYTASDIQNSYLPSVAFAGQTTRGYLQDIASQWKPGRGTPIVGALFEAAKYMRGEDIYWGNQPPMKLQAAHPSTYDGLFTDGGTTTTYVDKVEACGGTTGITCNKRKSCTTTTTTSTPVISPTPIAGQDCTAQPITKTCAANETFCGSAASAAECSTTVTPGTTQTVLCSLAAPTNSSACLASDPQFTQCTVPPNDVNCQAATDADCYTAHPTWVQCVDSGATPVNGLLTFNCKEPVTGDTSNPISCIKTTPDLTTVTCPDTQYSCTSTTSTTTCTHIVSASIISSGIKYKSPIKQQCQSNAIILLSDGEPTVNDSSTLVTGMIGSGYAKNCNATPKPSSGDWSSPESIAYYGRCGKELASYLAETDNSDATTGNNVEGDQPINLYTVGFSLNKQPQAQAYLKSLADAGGGDFYAAESSEDLISAFKDAISNVNRARLFSAPSYTPNAYSILAHGDVVYLPVFNRESATAWSGNLKKFKLKNGHLIEGVTDKAVMDADGKMRKDALDMWAATTPDHAAKGGGVASLLDPSKRNIKTDDGSGKLISLKADKVINTLLNASGDSEAKELIKYITGWTQDKKPRHHMGDIIHSKPVFVDYPNKRRVIFVGTNEGYLHAFDDVDGKELFAYMPRELLKNIKIQKDNPKDADHPYGVDGEITVWKGRLTASDNSDTVLLFFGLRRGGKAYYALNVTDPEKPKLQWKITPVSHNGAFDNLGYTWSTPKVAKVVDKKTNGEIKKALIFGGGYVDDNGLETGVSEATDSGTGADVFIVDMITGSLLIKLSGQNSSLSHAVPGGVRVMDMDGNDIVDHLYFADTGGKVWRADINTLEDVKLYQFANLQGSAKRAFFNEPDVAFFKRGGRFVATLSIGSGERPNPLDKNSQDAFFVLLDKHPGFYTANESPNKPDVITTSLLAPLSSLSNGLDKQIFDASYKDKKGWYYSLAQGEKVLTNAITFENKIIFTSFNSNNTATASSDPCDTSLKNVSSLYVLDLYTGKAVVSPTVISPGEISEPPMPYYPEMTSVNCSTKTPCLREPVLPLPRGVAPVNLAMPAKRVPRVYWMDHIK